MRLIIVMCVLACFLLLVGAGCEEHVKTTQYTISKNLEELHWDIDRILLLDKPSMCYPDFVNE